MTEIADPEFEWVDCPSPGCGLVAAAEDRGYADGAPVPVRMVKTVCPRQHAFVTAADLVGAKP